MNITAIRELWLEHFDAPFPKKLYDHDSDIVELDGALAGCILAYVESGRLDTRRVEIMRNCYQEINVICDSLTESDAKEYVSRLRELTKSVLAEAR